MIRLALAFSLIASAASAQGISQARDTFAGFQGDWAEPAKDCSTLQDTWSFGPNTVRAGNTQLQVLGIGGGNGSVLVDLASRSTGNRVPLNLTMTGMGLQVQGSGISVLLSRCGDADYALGSPPVPAPSEQDIQPGLPPADPPISQSPLEGPDALPSTDELRAALGQGADPYAGSDPLPQTDPLPQDDTASASNDEGDPNSGAESTFQSRYAGSWTTGGGGCDWRLSDSSITAEGQRYEVVNYSGSGERFGVQALDASGTPVTFTVSGSGAGMNVTRAVAGGESTSRSLSPC